MSEVWPYLPYLARGLLVTLEVTVLGMLLAVGVSLSAGLGRMSKRRPVRWLAGLFIEVFRGTSLIVQLFWFFYALPFFGITWSPLEAAVIALGLNEGAYGAEIVRGAIQSVSRGQWEAAIALNMTAFTRMRRIILPQAIPAMLPPFGNVAIDLLKGTSLVSLVTVSDLTFRAQIVRSTTGATTAVFSLILVWYFVISYLISLCRRWLERRLRVDRESTRRRYRLLGSTGAGGGVATP